MATKRQTAKALEGSIEKWRAIIAREGMDDGQNNCPLCGLFYDDHCDGCSVLKVVGRTMCLGTPYEKWSDHQENKHEDCGEIRCGTCTRLAKAELKFLESLRIEQPSPPEKESGN